MCSGDCEFRTSHDRKMGGAVSYPDLGGSSHTVYPQQGLERAQHLLARSAAAAAGVFFLVEYIMYFYDLYTKTIKTPYTFAI